ncbi:MAG: SUMF1/EgtB/PvdO family nonheme iron enzyme [Pseudomonadota bacterium]
MFEFVRSVRHFAVISILGCSFLSALPGPAAGQQLSCSALRACSGPEADGVRQKCEIIEATLATKVREVATQERRLQASQVEQDRRCNATLKDAFAAKTREIASLKAQIAALRDGQAAARSDRAAIQALQAKNSDLSRRNNELEQKIADATRQIEALKRERAEQAAPPAPASNSAPAGAGPTDCENCPAMQAVDVGVPVKLGAPPGFTAANWRSLQPGHEQPSKPFAMSRYEVTVGEFKTFLEKTGASGTFRRTCVIRLGLRKKAVEVSEPSLFAALSLNAPDDADEYPAVCISQKDAEAYAAWLTEQAGGEATFQLPTESQWEYAARSHRDYAPLPASKEYALCGMMNVADQRFRRFHRSQKSPVLSELQLTSGKAQTANCSDQWELAEPAAARAPHNKFGIVNLLGNVAEWTAKCWSQMSGGVVSTDCNNAAVRGGSFASRPDAATVWARQKVTIRDANTGYFDIGFRVVRAAR